MSTISLKFDDEKINQLKKIFKDDILPSPNEYIDTFIKTDCVTISIYTNKKVVFQGIDAHIYAKGFIDIKKNRQAGSDEVGTGDYFGPVVVCASIIEENDYPFIEESGITDSKAMSDSTILKLAPSLIQKFKHSLLILEPEKYNEVYEKIHNLNIIKAKMHNQAYINLLHKGYDIPKAAYVDQFVRPELYFEYIYEEKEIYRNLIFETKAEEKYPAVAVSSVISRYAFLKFMEDMSKNYSFDFHKGASEQVDNDILEFVKKNGKEKLSKVGKLHFKNTEIIK